jgi:hypothetical protein
MEDSNKSRVEVESSCGACSLKNPRKENLRKKAEVR